MLRIELNCGVASGAQEGLPSRGHSGGNSTEKNVSTINHARTSTLGEPSVSPEEAWS